MTRRDFYTALVYARQKPIIGKLAYYLLKICGAEIPCSVKIGPGFLLEHGGFGVVIHSQSQIGAGVHIYPGVTIGRADVYRSVSKSKFQGIIIEDDVILSPGAKILCKEGFLRIARGTVVGANAVLLQSTGPNEIWAGVPARCIGRRSDE